MGIKKLTDDQAFSYKTSKDNKLFITYYHKPIMVIKGEQAKKLLKKLAGANVEAEQMILAKATGNFKRGNEKQLNQK